MILSNTTRFTPEVSVLMPTYNAARYVDAAVVSILAQEFKDWELLAYDDGSDDQSFERLQFWAGQDSRIKIARPYDEHGNYVQICNEMINDARGKYIARMDADDISLSKRLMRTIQFLANKKSAIAVGGMAVALVEKNGKSEITDDFPWLKRCVEPVASEDVPVNGPLRYFNRLVHSTLLTYKEALIEMGGYDELFPLEDWDLMLRLTIIGDIYVLPQVLGIKRQHNTNYSKAHPNLQHAFQIIKTRHRLDIDELPRTSTL